MEKVKQRGVRLDRSGAAKSPVEQRAREDIAGRGARVAGVQDANVAHNVVAQQVQECVLIDDVVERSAKDGLARGCIEKGLPSCIGWSEIQGIRSDVEFVENVPLDEVGGPCEIGRLEEVSDKVLA